MWNFDQLKKGEKLFRNQYIKPCGNFISILINHLISTYTISGCPKPHWKNDGFCDDMTNIAECEYDGGDCCGDNVNTLYCISCFCLTNTTQSCCNETSLFGDGVCDACNNQAHCNWDGGDCCQGTANAGT